MSLPTLLAGRWTAPTRREFVREADRDCEEARLTLGPLLTNLLMTQKLRSAFADALLHNISCIEEDLPAKKLCYCMTSLGRTWQAVRTLAWNLLAMWPYRAHSTLYLADYNEDDVLCDYVHQRLGVALRVGLLRYYRCGELDHWHASIAKNGIHFAAIEDAVSQGWPLENVLVMNLDNDRVIGHRQPSELLRAFREQRHVLHCANPYDVGSYGLLGCSAALFRGAGGYNEQFLPSGCQDTDLLRRLQLGLAGTIVKLQGAEIVGFGIPNDTCNLQESTRQESVKAKVRNVAPALQGQRWGQMDQLNRARMNEDLTARRFVANNAAGWRPVRLVEVPGVAGGTTPPHAKVRRQEPRQSATSIRLVCFGLGKMASTFPHSATCAEWAGMPRQELNRLGLVELRRVLQQECSFFPEFIMDCRMYRNPDQCRHLTYHIGVHPEITRQICEDRRSTSHLFGGLYQTIMAYTTRVAPVKQLTVGVFCMSGTHRSVAVTFVLCHVLRRLGYQVEEPVFWSRWFWERAKCYGRRQACPDCVWSLSEAQQEVAMALWNEMTVRPGVQRGE